METRPKLGEIFVENGILTGKTVERMLLISKRVNKRFGTLLEELELVTSDELAVALATQHACRVASNFAGLTYSAELLATIPVEVAMQNYIFPLKLENNRLALAIADPTEMRVVRNLSVEKGLSITPYVATRKEIYEAICRNYLKKENRTLQGQTVLLVEADRQLGTTFADVLGRQGFRVIRVADGLEAYKAVLTEKPQAVVTDQDLPNLHENGFFDALRTTPELSLIPVILIAGPDGPEDEIMAFERGFFDFIQKPVQEATLVTRVKRALQFSQGNCRFN
ncbi:response regulator [Geomonas sp.]|uniref:response regulator n=1 Tax=Geomonas sp. TaxID=2651584 RepID=UPI002B481D02|nr:response regulator [Geomonas sp.]HJV35650.1 response regulator [Geomonas sp.]